MIRRPPRSTLSSSSAASDVYKRQGINAEYGRLAHRDIAAGDRVEMESSQNAEESVMMAAYEEHSAQQAKQEQEDEQRAFDILEELEELEHAEGVQSEQEGSAFHDSTVPPLRLYVVQPFPPEWDTGSLAWSPLSSDPDSLEAIVYLLFCRELVPSLEYDIKPLANQYVAPNGSLPALQIKRDKAVVPCLEVQETLRNLLLLRRPPNTLPLYELSLIHISEPTRLLSISYAVFCLKKKKQTTENRRHQ
eukprot:TRINITY_DN30801_c0_g1_i1.p1 TRINITY_DN30801_c0_g1~~TRINITY_DN30801_c0_g1_i1.p1  ORF type:complete len:248 (+),score=81.54 TRINITY_DN30801_c0_g1_i1:145-888(+)